MSVEEVLKKWSDLKVLKNENGKFEVIYKLIDVKDDTHKIVREELTLSLTKCLAKLLMTYPEEIFNEKDIERCKDIFKTIIENASYVEMDTKDIINFGFEDFYDPGHFSLPRHQVLQDLYHASPKMNVICFEVNMDDGESFTLLQLLKDDRAFAIFNDSWNARPTWNFADEWNDRPKSDCADKENIPGKITNQNVVIIDAIESMNNSMKSFIQELADKEKNISIMVIEKQRETIDEKNRIIRKLQSFIEQHFVSDNQNNNAEKESELEVGTSSIPNGNDWNEGREAYNMWAKEHNQKISSQKKVKQDEISAFHFGELQSNDQNDNENNNNNI